jgi:phosphohistidine phosphatase
MFLYLVQHAEAKKEEEDPLRPLSERGIRDITKVALYVSQLNIPVSKIFHSRKLRARQTGEILFEYLRPMKGISETEGLFPLDAANIWAERLKDITDDIFLVGHTPHLGRLASLLLFGNADNIIISFKMAGVVCLKREDAGAWSLHWMLTPETVIEARGLDSYCDGL